MLITVPDVLTAAQVQQARAKLDAADWIDGDRSMLFDLDTVIQGLAKDVPGHASGVKLTGVYHNLLRRWAEM